MVLDGDGCNGDVSADFGSDADGRGLAGMTSQR